MAVHTIRLSATRSLGILFSPANLTNPSTVFKNVDSLWSKFMVVDAMSGRSSLRRNRRYSVGYGPICYELFSRIDETLPPRSSLPSCLDKTMRESVDFRDLLEGKELVVDRFPNRISAIISLLVRKRPSTVFKRIALIIVASVECMLRGWLRSNIISKCFVAQPLVANGNAPSSIVGVMFISRVKASLFHISPSRIKNPIQLIPLLHPIMYSTLNAGGQIG